MAFDLGSAQLPEIGEVIAYSFYCIKNLNLQKIDPDPFIQPYNLYNEEKLFNFDDLGSYGLRSGVIVTPRSTSSNTCLICDWFML